MVRRSIIFAFCALLLSFAFKAEASIVFQPFLSYQALKTTDDTGAINSDDQRMLIADVRAGYLFDENGLYLGVLYRIENGNIWNGKIGGYAFGPSIGYQHNGLNVNLTYIMGADRKYNIGGVDRKIYDAAGWQFDIAWAPLISPGFGLGPQISFRSVKYERSKIGAANETANGFAESTFTPGLILWFNF